MHDPGAQMNLGVTAAAPRTSQVGSFKGSGRLSTQRGGSFKDLAGMAGDQRRESTMTVYTAEF